MSDGSASCVLCGRTPPTTDYLEKHHMIPRAKGGKITELVCIDCGNQIHQLFSNNELRDVYNSMDMLRRDERVQRWVRWIRKKKEYGICMKKKKRS